MKNKIPFSFIILFFASMSLGKGISDYTSPPSFDYILSGSVQMKSGLAQAGASVFFDLAVADTSYIGRYYSATTTNDSGLFQMRLQMGSEFETGIRIVAALGQDTMKGPWLFTRNVSREERTETITTNDCNSHKKIIPIAEIYTFPAQTLILP